MVGVSHFLLPEASFARIVVLLFHAGQRSPILLVEVHSFLRRMCQWKEIVIITVHRHIERIQC